MADDRWRDDESRYRGEDYSRGGRSRGAGYDRDETRRAYGRQDAGRDTEREWRGGGYGGGYAGRPLAGRDIDRDGDRTGGGYGRTDFGRDYDMSGVGYDRDNDYRGGSPYGTTGRGETGRGYGVERGYDRARGYGQDYRRSSSSYGGARQDWGRSDYPGNWQGGRNEDRSWWDRATDEVSSWFGDEDAERRREMDARNSHYGRGPRDYTRSDERIREDINDRLTDDWYLDASSITVAVSGGEVTLTGTVNRREDKRRAEDLAEAVSGVKHVQNNLRIDQGSMTETTMGGARGGTTGAATSAMPGTGTAAAGTARTGSRGGRTS